MVVCVERLLHYSMKKKQIAFTMMTTIISFDNGRKQQQQQQNRRVAVTSSTTTTNMVSIFLFQQLVLWCLIVLDGSVVHQSEAAASYTPKSSSSIRSISFSLVNTDTDQTIRSLVGSTTVNTIDLRKEPSDNLSIVGMVASGTPTVAHVSFYMDGTTFVRDEKAAPYSLGGDTNGNYSPYNDFETKLCTIRNVTSIAYNSDETIIATGSILIKVIDDRCSTTPMKPPVQSPIIQPIPNDVVAYKASASGSINGELRTWHKITIGFHGPPTSETAVPNPFLYYRLTVTFVHGYTKRKFIVPGYYATDGNSANTGATSGKVWLVHFSPPYSGVWTWTTSFVYGTNIAINTNLKQGTPSQYIHKKKGSFTVLSTNKKGKDLRYHGRLKYIGEHYLQFSGTKQSFLKVGVDSPENLLAYDEFDNTPNTNGRRKSWSAHLVDYSTVEKSPTWNGGKGKALIGAINYLSNVGMNVFSFLTMNINGDDRNVFPYLNTSDYTRIDVSKVSQWEVVFEHADRLGMYLHFKTQEQENDQLLDNGELGIQRKLYYRELMARFGHHLALNWNLGEENTNTETQLKAFLDYFDTMDPYKHPIVLHTFPPEKEEVYTPLLGYKRLTGVSLQVLPINTIRDTREWVQSSATAKHKWIVTCDEQGTADAGVVPDQDDYYHDSIRTNVLWGNLMNTGGGVEYYFGYQYDNSDLTCQDFRSREHMFQLSKIAIDFFHSYLPFWNMSIATSLIDVDDNDEYTNSCLSTKDNKIIAIYLPNGGSVSIKLPTTTNTTTSSSSVYTIDWYDPEIGGPLKKGSIPKISVVGGSSSKAVSIGNPPYKHKTRKGVLFPPLQDWVVLIRKK